jgi:hypothetical protein
MPRSEIAIRRRGIAIPRANLAEIRRGHLRACQGMAMPSKATAAPPAVTTAQHQGIAKVLGRRCRGALRHPRAAAPTLRARGRARQTAARHPEATARHGDARGR